MLINFESSAIEHLIRQIPTSKKRTNARNKIKSLCNTAFDHQIQIEKETLRSLRSESDRVKRIVYKRISDLEIEKLKINSGDYGF